MMEKTIQKTETETTNQNQKMEWETFDKTIATPMCERFQKIQDEFEKLNDDWMAHVEKHSVNKDGCLTVTLTPELSDALSEYERIEGHPFNIDEAILGGIRREKLDAKIAALPPIKNDELVGVASAAVDSAFARLNECSTLEEAKAKVAGFLSELKVIEGLEGNLGKTAS